MIVNKKAIRKELQIEKNCTNYAVTGSYHKVHSKSAPQT